jgi:hypothetical protein
LGDPIVSALLVHFDDKPVMAALRQLLDELKAAAGREGALYGQFDLLREVLLEELRDRRVNVFTCVRDVAADASSHITIRLNEGLYGLVTACALDRLGHVDPA